jgi:hypothetical protein
MMIFGAIKMEFWQYYCSGQNASSQHEKVFAPKLIYPVDSFLILIPLAPKMNLRILSLQKKKKTYF